jgi:hypothetical protein
MPTYNFKPQFVAPVESGKKQRKQKSHCLLPSGHFWSVGNTGVRECLFCSARQKVAV